MVKEIEALGLPAVHVASIVPISQTVGANRIVPAIAIPYPVGDPDVEEKKEKEIRRRLMDRALKALSTSIEEQTLF